MSISPYLVSPRLRLAAVLITTLLAAGLLTIISLLLWVHDLI